MCLFFLGLDWVCFIFSNGSIYDVGIVFHITITIRWRFLFYRPDVIIAEKAKIVAFESKKCRCSGRRSGSPPFPDLYVFLSHFLTSRVWSWKRNRGRPMVFSRSHNNVFSFPVCWYGTCNSDAGDSVFLHMSCGKTQGRWDMRWGLVPLSHTPPSTWVVSERAAIRLCRPVLFHFPHERFNRIHRAPPYWLFRHSRFPFAKKIEARQRRGRPFLTTVYDCSILLRSDVHPIPTSHRTTSTGHER